MRLQRTCEAVLELGEVYVVQTDRPLGGVGNGCQSVRLKREASVKLWRTCSEAVHLDK